MSQHEWSDCRPNAPADVSEIGDGRFDRDLHLLRHAAIDDRHRTELRSSRGALFATTKESRDLIEWPLRRGQAYALRRFFDQRFESLQCQRQMGTAFGPRYCMDLVDNHRADTAEHAASLYRGQHDVERFRRRDQNVRGLSKHPCARGGWRVSRANGDANLWKLLAFGREPLSKLRERPFEISLNVVVESLKRRDVKKLNRIRERLFRSAHDQVVQLPQKRRQRFPGPGWSEYEGVRSAGDRRPTLALRITRLPEGLLEPPPHERVKARQHGRASSHITGQAAAPGELLKNTPQFLCPPL